MIQFPQPMCRFHVVITQKQAKGFFGESIYKKTKQPKWGVGEYTGFFDILQKKFKPKITQNFKNNSKFKKNSA